MDASTVLPYRYDHSAFDPAHGASSSPFCDFAALASTLHCTSGSGRIVAFGPQGRMAPCQHRLLIAAGLVSVCSFSNAAPAVSLRCSGCRGLSPHRLCVASKTMIRFAVRRNQPIKRSALRDGPWALVERRTHRVAILQVSKAPGYTASRFIA